MQRHPVCLLLVTCVGLSLNGKAEGRTLRTPLSPYPTGEGGMETPTPASSTQDQATSGGHTSKASQGEFTHSESDPRVHSGSPTSPSSPVQQSVSTVPSSAVVTTSDFLMTQDNISVSPSQDGIVTITETDFLTTHSNDSVSSSKDSTIVPTPSQDSTVVPTPSQHSTDVLTKGPNMTFQSHVMLDTNSVLHCLGTEGVTTFHALQLEVRIEPLKGGRYPLGGSSSRQCHVDLLVQQDMVVKAHLVNVTSVQTRGWHVRVVDRAGLVTLLDIRQSTSPAAEFSLGPGVSVHITRPPRGRLFPPRPPFSLHLKLTAVAPQNQLEVIYVSKTQGYVQTPRWDGQVHYPRDMNSRMYVNMPPRHDVMLSFREIELGQLKTCQEDSLRVFKQVLKGKVLVATSVLLLCSNFLLPIPEVHKAYSLVFIFSSNSVSQYPGFRALFSIHAEWASPRQTSEGVWNCSVATWASFRQHFPCNLESNCLHSEDEAHCPYVSASCGPGGIRAGRGCYVLHNLGQVKLSYGAMKERCQGRGHGSLVSLNTVQEWQDVWHVLRQGRWKNIMVGLQPVPPTWPPMYQGEYQWADGSVAYFTRVSHVPQGDMCAYFYRNWPMWPLQGSLCYHAFTDHYILCELPSPLTPTTPLPLPQPSKRPSQTGHVTCSSGHVTHNFLACDLDSHCWAESDSSAPCKAPLTSQPAMFSCAEGRVEGVPYSLVCDHRQDCGDGSDERFCSFPPCRAPEQFTCHNGQCIPKTKLCSVQLHCWDKSHQLLCDNNHANKKATRPPPGIVDMAASGRLHVTKASPARGPDGDVVCADTHVQCGLPGYYCLPVYLRCNQVHDCPGGQDELDCANATCPGFYRCRASQVCVHALHLCDGLFQCPQHDDEAGCGLTCPPSCVCHGLAFTCSAPFTSPHLPHLRYLQARGSFLTLAPLRNSTMLVYLGLAACNLTRLPPLVFPNLRHLDLSANRIAVLPSSHVTGCPHLHTLSLSANPLSQVLGVVTPQQPSCSLHSLDLSGTALQSLDTHNFTCFSRLRLLNLSGSGVQRVSPAGLRPFGRLEKVDLRGCAVRDFSRGLLERQSQLQALWADNYKLCCPAVLPAGFATANCFAPSDEISSCDTLLRSDFFRLFLYFYAFLALTGNAGSFLYRTFVNRAERKLGFGIFVAHLCLSDSLMGVYLAAIGVADRLYAGSYLWEDLAWRQSAVCQAAGFCSLLSSEVSTFLICLITVDRFLVLRFPFSRVRFRQRSAQTACVACWLTGLALALVPLLPPAAHWRFYQQSSICLPLPVTRQPFAGRPYSMGVMVLLNSILFLLIAAGQAFIYRAIGHNSVSLLDCSKSCSRDLTIARRLITVAMSDFLCWFPIGVLGLLASQDVPVPGQVRVGVAIFVLPLNSALNPFLYTLNIIHEKRRQAYFTKLQALVQSQARAKGTTHQ